MAAGIYIHIPFCKSRCSYCDFATEVYRDSGAAATYVDALCDEIRAFDYPPAEVDTIYFGGGTPSILAPEQIERIANGLRQKFNLLSGAEVTLEMNPATVTSQSLAGFRAAGVNRASFGAQTFNDFDLKLLARGHDANDVRATFNMLRGAGYNNISFDLIAGLPGQTISDWKFNLESAIDMDPEHLSLYLLEIHEGTPLAEQVFSGRRPQPDPEVAAEMYEYMVDRLDSAGYEQYEISNFSKPGFASRHNSKYWTLDPVYGFGVSAHSFDGTQRYANARDTQEYVRLIGESGSAESMREVINVASEYIFLGLRLTAGVDLAQYARHYGQSLTKKYDAGIADLLEDQLIEVDTERIRLTQRGMLFSNHVFAAFV